MSDPKKPQNQNPLEGIDDLDWDDALSSWEKDNFSASLAPDADAKADSEKTIARASAAPVAPVVAEAALEVAIEPAHEIAASDASGETETLSASAEHAPTTESAAIGAMLAETVSSRPPSNETAPLGSMPLVPDVPREVFGSNTPSAGASVPRAVPRPPPSSKRVSPTESSPAMLSQERASIPNAAPSLSTDVAFEQTGEKDAHPPSEPTRVVPPAAELLGPASRTQENEIPKAAATGGVGSLVAGQSVEDDELALAVQLLESLPPPAPSNPSAEPPPPKRQSDSAALHAPRSRAHDPDEVTGNVGAHIVRAIARGREDDAQTALRERADLPIATSEDASEPRVKKEAPVFTDERAARAYIDDATREAFEIRAAWLEEEARANEDPEAQARELIAVSEILALLGETEQALRLAIEARNLAPANPLGRSRERARCRSVECADGRGSPSRGSDGGDCVDDERRRWCGKGALGRCDAKCRRRRARADRSCSARARAGYDRRSCARLRRCRGACAGVACGGDCASPSRS
jgi:hypothetical protein